MADGHDATLISKDRDANAVANPIYTQLTDGTDVALINGSGELLVAGTFTSNAEYAEDSAHTTADVGQYVLAVRQDSLASSVSTDGDYASLKVDSVGSLYTTFSNTTIAVTNAGTFAVQVDGDALTALQLIDDIVHVEDAAHTTGDSGAFVLAVRNEGLTTLTSADLDYSGVAVTKEGAVYTEILQGGAVNSAANPIFVQPVEEGASANEIHDYDTAAAVAKDATSNHDYTVANTTFLLKQITTSSSGDVKVEVQTGPLASLATVWVGFVGSKAGGSIQHKFCPPKEVPVTSTGTVRLIRTNRGSVALDLYSTIEGNDI
jgi:hypothetical protein